MVASHIITAINEIERELKLGVWRNPKRKAYLQNRLAQLTREVTALGFTEEEIKSGEINVGSDKQVVSKTYYVPLPSWTTSTDAKDKS
ncbi:MAG: hypothetical protein ACLQFW_23575 [Xanthobacteraceae bacterium]